jgi:hypothetical protein
MNIPDDKVTHYKDDDSIVINDERIFRGILQLARIWGYEMFKDANVEGVEEIDRIMATFADKVADLRAKYEVEDDLLNASPLPEVPYYDELSALLADSRRSLFDAFMETIADDTAIELMLDVLHGGDRSSK